MKLHFTENSDFVKIAESGSKILLDDRFGQHNNTDALSLNITFQESDTLTIRKKGNDCSVICREPAHYFHGLNYILHHPDEDFEKQEPVFFRKNGFMLDCSRNAVATTGSVKALLRFQAKAGMNRLFLYTEETYEVPGIPYFGAYRGRYSRQELKELDDYAANLGIELVPCIQTLAHLKNFLKWPAGEELKDTPDILKVGSKKVYEFIEQLLTSLKDSFRTRNIHIGMDEAVAVGLGKYLEENGYTEKSVLIQEHSLRVFEICRKLGWEPMIWSDMYITSNTGKGYYSVDENTDTTDWKKPDRGLGLVYWDYYNTDAKVYRNMLRVHKELSDRVAFAGGIWNWNGISPNYGKAFRCTEVSLKECQRQGIQDVFATGWMDNGAETPLEAIYPGAAAFAFMGFHSELNREEFSQFFEDCADAKLEDFYLLDTFDSLFKGIGNNNATDNPSKYLLFQDAMLGMFDYHIQRLDTQTYYSNLAEKLEKCEKNAPAYQDFFGFYKYLARVLSEKADLGIRLKSAYDAGDLAALEAICRKVIPNTLENLEHMHRLREKLWLESCKPFGYEILDIKLNGVAGRLKACRRRIEAYLEGKTSRLEELEQERLPYWELGDKCAQDLEAELRDSYWQNMISACALLDTL